MSEITEIIAKYSALPQPAVTEWVPGTLEDIEAGILFVLATWSAPAISSFRGLTRLLARLPFVPALLVCDNDALPQQLAQWLGVPQGRGETFWIRRGRIVASIHDFRSVDLELVVRENTELLVIAHG